MSGLQDHDHDRIGAEKDVIVRDSISSPTESGKAFKHELAREGSILLIPAPSSDPNDPLNWSFKRKAAIVLTLFLAMFGGFAAPFCGQLNLNQQAALYHKSVVQITYFNSAASAGLATGGYFWYPLSLKFGRSSVIFWCILGCLAAQIWAPLMTGHDQYTPYLVSRYFAAFFGVVVSILGPRYLTDLFFLHQRGRAFTVLHLALNAGASAGPTFSGFIAANNNWPIEYWWSVALLAFTIIPVLLFLEETGFDRSEGAVNRIKPDSWIKDRVETFLPGHKVVPAIGWGTVFKRAGTPFTIAIAPVLLIIAGFDTISFGFYVALNALTPVWLQKPKKAGGLYGFTVTENAAFSLIHWIGFIFGLVYGHFLSDRIPLWFVRRNKGIWKPEYRLHTLWPTNFILMPLGLGLIGIAMHYKLHWIAMAFGHLFVTIGSLVSIPITVNYICECFRTHTIEATLVLNSMRLFLGLSINFYVNPWIEEVGIGWVYGMMAFFCLFSFCFLILLMFFGHKIRALSPFRTSQSEEGQAVLSKPDEAHGI